MSCRSSRESELMAGEVTSVQCGGKRSNSWGNSTDKARVWANWLFIIFLFYAVKVYNLGRRRTALTYERGKQLLFFLFFFFFFQASMVERKERIEKIREKNSTLFLSV